MCLPYIADGRVLDDRGTTIANNIHDTNGMLLKYQFEGGFISLV